MSLLETGLETGLASTFGGQVPCFSTNRRCRDMDNFDPETTLESVRYHGDPRVIIAFLKYRWSLGDDHRLKDAFGRLKDLAMDLSRTTVLQQTTQAGISGCSNVPLVVRVYLKLGTWQCALSPGLDDDSIQEILNAFCNATHYATKRAKLVVAAVAGYFHSITCSAHSKGVDDSLQDILCLLTLWFNHGATSEVRMALQRGFSLVNINTWLVVLPPIIARIHSNNHAARELIQHYWLLCTLFWWHVNLLAICGNRWWIKIDSTVVL